MDTDTSESECKQRASSRGKNFADVEDVQICQSWIHASKISNRTGSNAVWGNLYDHAISNLQDMTDRSVNGLRLRFMVIQRAVRKFLDIYKLNPDSALETALQTYKSKYKKHFKFLRCWEVLKESPQFLKIADSHTNAASKTQDMPTSKLVKKPRPSAELSSRSPRGMNVQPDEIQALLKACCDIGVEDARSKGERIEPLLYDVQQQMTNYGNFPERKLYMIKTQYLRTEKNYRNGYLVPYPPEARILWGKIDTSNNDESNDAGWNAKIQYNLDNKKGFSFLSNIEIEELLKEALNENLESFPQAKRKIVCKKILSTMHTKKLCRRKNAEGLLKDYLRLKEQFFKGVCKNLPPEATTLWTADGIEEKPIPEYFDEELETSPQDSMMKYEVLDLCRICQAEQFEQMKDLFLDVYKGKTYATILKETLHLEMPNDGLRSAVICSYCSTFIENLVNFVQQCRESCLNNDFICEEITVEKQELFGFEVSAMSESELNDADFINGDNDYRLSDNGILDDEKDATDDGKEEIQDDTMILEDIPNEDPAEKEIDEETRKEINYRKYLESRRSNKLRVKSLQSKKQCHLCGKKVIALADHLESHSGKEFKCNFCDWVCPNRRQLRIHQNRHTKKHVFPCRYCDKIFYVWSSRKNHEDTHNECVFKCDMCDMEYKHKSYLLSHKKSHTSRNTQFEMSSVQIQHVPKSSPSQPCP